MNKMSFWLENMLLEIMSIYIECSGLLLKFIEFVQLIKPDLFTLKLKSWVDSCTSS